MSQDRELSDMIKGKYQKQDNEKLDTEYWDLQPFLPNLGLGVQADRYHSRKKIIVFSLRNLTTTKRKNLKKVALRVPPGTVQATNSSEKPWLIGSTPESLQLTF